MLLELQALELLRCVAQAEEFLHQCVGVNGLAHLGRIVPEGKQHPHDCVHKDRLREFQQLVFFHSFKRSGLDILDIADFLTLLQFKVHLDFTKFPFEAAAGSVRLYNNRQLQYALRHLMLLHKLLHLSQFIVGCINALNSNAFLRALQGNVNDTMKDK